MENLISSTRAAASVAAMTISSGLGLLLSVIPDNIGKASTVVGMALSIVLIWSHWSRTRTLQRKGEIEIEILEEQHAQLLRRRADDRTTSDHAADSAAVPPNSKPAPD